MIPTTMKDIGKENGNVPKAIHDVVNPLVVAIPVEVLHPVDDRGEIPPNKEEEDDTDLLLPVPIIADHHQVILDLREVVLEVIRPPLHPDLPFLKNHPLKAKIP